MGSSFSPYSYFALTITLLLLFVISTIRPAHADPDYFQDYINSAGFIKLPNTSAKWFYQVFQPNTNATDIPVVIYVNGGPGYIMQLAMFYGNGPFRLTDNLELVSNEHSWHKEMVVVYLEQPTGTGFSTTTDETDIRKTTEEVAGDIHQFLKGFLNKHPQYVGRDLFLAALSYGCRFMMSLGTLIIRENKNQQVTSINVKGVACANPWLDPKKQYQSYSAYALKQNLINLTQYYHMKKPLLYCQFQVQKHCEGTKSNFYGCAKANDICNDILWEYIFNPLGSRNHYDIRKQCNGSMCYDFSNLELFLDQKTVRLALGVPSDLELELWSQTVNSKMSGDVMRNFSPDMPVLIENGIKILIITAEHDLVVTWTGCLEMVKEMKWSGQEDFLQSPNVTLNVAGEPAGWMKSQGLLDFLMVYNAGHMLSMDQPKASLEIMTKWTKGIPL